jgi:hypothetical protein
MNHTATRLTPDLGTGPAQNDGTAAASSLFDTLVGSRVTFGERSFPYGASAWRRGQLALGGSGR